MDAAEGIQVLDYRLVFHFVGNQWKFFHACGDFTNENIIFLYLSLGICWMICLRIIGAGYTFAYAIIGRDCWNGRSFIVFNVNSLLLNLVLLWNKKKQTMS